MLRLQMQVKPLEENASRMRSTRRGAVLARALLEGAALWCGPTKSLVGGIGGKVMVGLDDLGGLFQP